ncbi:MAG: benzoate-CoA ligase family protein [Gammaproteobacteria bacterium]|nr:benzoate-CoA ligase family protein [Gammaproteobacteria bacterium]
MEYPRYYNAAVDLVDRNVDEGRGDKVAFIDPARSLTYAALRDGCARFAGLLADFGLLPETRVAMIMLDTVDWPVVFLGAIRAGAVPIPLNTLLTTEQYAYILGDCRARALFVSAPLLPTVAPALEKAPALEHVFVVGGDAGPYLDFAAEIAGHLPKGAPAETCADEVAFWLYSSGSTGMPKGARHVHTSPMETARLYAQGVLGMREDDVVFSAAKLFFAYGLGNSLSFPMSVGATTVLWPERPTPPVVFEQLARHRATIFAGVPTLYAALLAAADGAADAGSLALRCCISAGEALPAEIARKWKQRFGVEILDGVGSTEMLHIFLSNRPDDVRYGRSGTAVPGYELRLVDEHGADAGAGEVGEMLVRGTTSADGYWNQRAKSRATFVGEWTRTGDKYILDADGYYEYCGRTDDMFKVSGNWVSPFEVESALISHPAVLEAAVVAAEDEQELVKPKAFVVLKQGTDTDGLAEALKEHVKQQVGAWKYPRWIEFVADLPKTATGKIQRFKLRER